MGTAHQPRSRVGGDRPLIPRTSLTARQLAAYGVLGGAFVSLVLGVVAPARATDFYDARAFRAGASAWSGWRMSGFAPAKTHPGVVALTIPGVDSLGSFIGGDVHTGTAESPWIPVDSDVALWVVGYPADLGNSLHIDLRSDSGTVRERFDRNPRELWTRWIPRAVPSGSNLQIRITAVDGSTSPQGWFAFSEPFALGARGALRALARTALTVCLVVSMLFAPGLAWRTVRGRRLRLGWIGVPGFFLLVVVGAAIWRIDRWAPAAAPLVAAAVLGLCLRALVRDRPIDALSVREWRALVVSVVVVLVGTAKASYSRGPPAELCGERISRTLEYGDRSDPRIPYANAQLVLMHLPPHGTYSDWLFAPYAFSHRGPLAGIAAAPIVAASGARVAASAPDQVWTIFDSQGYAAYRIAMMAFASLALLATYSLAEVLGGSRVAWVALLLAAGSPFVQHEVYFTWPKLLASAFVLLGLELVWTRRPLAAGLTLGVGFWCHPGALLGVLLAGALWVVAEQEEQRRCGQPGDWGSVVRRRSLYRGGIAILGGTAAVVGLWRVVNAGHFHQDVFWEYATMAYGIPAPTFPDWARMRWESFVNTIVPGHEILVDPLHGKASLVLLVARQYWLSLPFAAGVFALPFLAIGTYRGVRQRPMEWVLLVGVPFVAFTSYWGASNAGMMREGLMHAWFLVLLVLAAQAWNERAAARRIVFFLLAARALETLFMMLVPTLMDTAITAGNAYRAFDLFGAAIMIGGTVFIAWRVQGQVTLTKNRT